MSERERYRANPALCWYLQPTGDWRAVRNPEVEFAAAVRGLGLSISHDWLCVLQAFGTPCTLEEAHDRHTQRHDTDWSDFAEAAHVLLDQGLLLAMGGRSSVAIVSPGGVATTTLVKFVGRYVDASYATNAAGLKHAPAPPTALPGLRAALFVGGDPVELIGSLFRRNYQTQMAFFLRRAHLLGPDDTIDDYAALRSDVLGIGRQIRAWTDRRALAILPYPVAYVDYRDLWDQIPRVIDFLGLPPSAIAEFPARRERSSSSNELALETRAALRNTYRDTAELLDSLRPFTLLHTPDS